MNRALKFRAWDFLLKEIVLSQLMLVGGDGTFYKDSGWDTVTAAKQKEGRYIILQYTGLKDKHGKEIYEGDVIQDQLGQVYKVFWCEDGVFLPGFSCMEIGKKHSTILMTHPVEVIGNIFENPELITAIDADKGD